eukprot:1510059-Lingulodinium_polyedra.AAC.1
MEPPFHLCSGDLHQNLEELSQVPELPLEATTGKLWKLLRLGFSRDALVECLELVASVSWSTTVTEQGHASASKINRCHDGMGTEALVTRSMVLSMKGLLTQSKEGLKLERLVNKLKSKSGFKPSYITGRQAYLKDLVDATSHQKKQGRCLAPTV